MSDDKIERMRNLAAKLADCAELGGTVTLDQGECLALQEALLLAAAETARRVNVRLNAGRKPRTDIENLSPRQQRRRKNKEQL